MPFMPFRRSGQEALEGPLRRSLVDMVPSELDHHQGTPGAEQIGYLVQGQPQVFDVVQGQDRQDMVELSSIGELLDPHTAEDGTFGSLRVDRSHGVTPTREGSGKLSLPAAYLKHTGGRIIDLVEDELLYAPLPSCWITHDIVRVHSRKRRGRRRCGSL